MKTNFRIFRNIFLTAVFSASGLLLNFADAQNMVAKLTDAEIRTILPILKNEVTGLDNLVKGMETDRNLNYQLFRDIQSGKTDPLDWLKKHSKHILVPPEAKYEPACSRAVSLGPAQLSSTQELEEVKPGAVPTAIFTFGKDLSWVNKQLLGENITMESYERFLQNVYDADDKGYEEIKSILSRTIAFYTKNGFQASYESSFDGPSSTTAIFYHPEDEGYVSGNVYHIDFKLFQPDYLEIGKMCHQHPAGPSIEIRAEPKLLEKLFSSSGDNNVTDANTKNSLKKAGISEDRYAMVKISLLNARTDSENPDAIEVPSFDFTPTTAEEKEMAKAFAALKEDALARKSNVTIYNKFKAELDPILDILQLQMYLP